MDLKDRYYTVLHSLPDHVFIFSESAIYIDVYGGEENATNFDCKAFIGRTLYDVLPLEMATEFHSYIIATLETNQTQIIEYQFDQADMSHLPSRVSSAPRPMWFEGTIKPLQHRENGERTVVWMARNNTQRHDLELRLKELSEIDELTGIYNRRAFHQSLSDTLKEYHLFKRYFSLLMIDIDYFKRINDSVGHSCGDDVIKHVVGIFLSELRSSDEIGRIGGEEFAITLKDADLDAATIVAEKIRSKLEKSECHTDDFMIKTTVSLGATMVMTTDNDTRKILSRADKAMYYSKANGRNRVSVYSDQIEYSDPFLNQESNIIFKSR